MQGYNLLMIYSTDMKVSGDENELYWSNLNQGFFNVSYYASGWKYGYIQITSRLIKIRS